MATILIIDKQPFNREFLTTVLGHDNHHLLRTKKSTEGLNFIKNEPVDLIITDTLMQKIDGVEFVNQTFVNPGLEKIPIIFYTTYHHMKEARSLARKYGVHFVLRNPSKPHVILETVEKALKGTQSLSIANLKALPAETSSMISLERAQLNNSLLKHFAEIASISKDFKNLFKASHKLAEEHQLSLDKISTLSENLNKLQILVNQLINMTMVNLDTFSEKDSNKFLSIFCKGAQQVLGATYCVLGIFDEKGKKFKHFLVSEMDKISQPKMDLETLANQGLIGRLLKQCLPLKINNSFPLPKAELFQNHPPITNFLGFPILFKTHLYGFMYFANKTNDTPFNDEDLFIGEALLNELSIRYENFRSFEREQCLAKQLQLEVLERKKAQEKSRKSELLFQEFSENINEVFWKISPKMDQTLYVSPSFEKIWGRSVESCYANPQLWFESIISEDQPHVQASMQKVANNEVDHISFEFSITRPDHSLRHINARGYTVKDKQGKLRSILGISSDVTEYERIKKILETKVKIENILKKQKHIKNISNKILKIICKNLSWDLGALWLVDEKEKVLRFIDHWQGDSVYPDNFVKNSFEGVFKKGEDFLGNVWQNKKGSWITNLKNDAHFLSISHAKKEKLQAAAAVPIIHQNKIYGVLSFFSFDKKELYNDLVDAVENIGHLIGEFIYLQHTQEDSNTIAQMDVLTGLINRSFFKQAIEKLFKNSPSFLPIIFLDIDRFKLINEAMGHEVGDLLIRAIAAKLSKLSDCLSSRFGADKFILALTKSNNFEEINKYLLKIQKVFENPFVIRGQEVFVTVSMGISIYPENGSNINVLFQKAEVALQQVKKKGGNHFQFSSSVLSTALTDKLSIEMNLWNALRENQFCLYYQPKVNLKTGFMCGLEALIRWQHPEKGILSPLSFIPIAEETGLIVPIGEWVIQEVCRQIQQDELLASDEIPIAINLSIYQLAAHHNLLSYIKKTINKFDINPRFLEFEVTESIFSENISYTEQFINAIKRMGFKISLDDFGTGYSSLQYLQNFSIDKIKIDKSFIDKLPHNRDNLAIVTAIIALSHALRAVVIAEGVETKKQLDSLIKANCDEIQGYYFSEPVPADQIKKMIMEEKCLKLP